MSIFRRKKLSAEERAAEIKAKHEKKMVGQGLFTPAQEKLRDELGLKPGAKINKKIKAEQKREKKIKDPLSKRQRALMEELGLVKKDDQTFDK